MYKGITGKFGFNMLIVLHGMFLMSFLSGVVRYLVSSSTLDDDITFLQRAWLTMLFATSLGHKINKELKRIRTRQLLSYSTCSAHIIIYKFNGVIYQADCLNVNYSSVKDQEYFVEAR